MASITWTDEAKRWLREIREFIALDNKDAATRTVRGIHARTEILRRYPEFGHVFPDIPGENIRIILYSHYRIAYLIKPSGDIDILGVFHGALDINRYLQ